VFDCSERFRANSNGKRTDIWLIYRCRSCEATKNITVVSRQPVARVPRPLLLAAEANDAAVARRYARDVALLRRCGASVAEGDSFVVSASCSSVRDLVFPEPLLVRPAHVVAEALGISRAAASALVPRDLRLVAGLRW
jgi:hypothetical protein